MLIVDEALELLATPEGRQKILAEALSRASAKGATRNEIDAAKEMRQCALAAAALLEQNEATAIAARLEAAIAERGVAPVTTSGEEAPRESADAC